MWSSANLIVRGRRAYDAWLERFYFAPAAPTGLAICRVWLYAFVIYTALKHDLRPWAEVPGELWRPIFILSWVPSALRSPLVLTFVYGALLTAAVCSLLGLATKVSTRLTLGLALFAFGLPQCFGKVGHSLTLIMFALGIFAVSQCGDALSLDALRRRQHGQPRPGKSSEYRWPIALMQALMMTAFFAAGLCKLRNCGLAWFTTDSLINTIVRNHYTGHNPPTGLGLWMVQFPLLCQFAAFLSLWVEITAPLALYNRWYRWWVVPNLFAMQVGIFLTMGVLFEAFWICYLFWVDWNWVAERLAGMANTFRRPAPQSQLTGVDDSTSHRRAA